MVLTDEVKAFIQSQKDAGQTDAQITATLISGGWIQNDITQALQEFSEQSVSVTPPKPAAAPEATPITQDQIVQTTPQDASDPIIQNESPAVDMGVQAVNTDSDVVFDTNVEDTLDVPNTAQFSGMPVDTETQAAPQNTIGQMGSGSIDGVIPPGQNLAAINTGVPNEMKPVEEIKETLNVVNSSMRPIDPSESVMQSQPTDVLPQNANQQAAIHEPMIAPPQSGTMANSTPMSSIPQQGQMMPGTPQGRVTQSAQAGRPASPRQAAVMAGMQPGVKRKTKPWIGILIILLFFGGLGALIYFTVINPSSLAPNVAQPNINFDAVSN